MDKFLSGCDNFLIFMPLLENSLSFYNYLNNTIYQDIWEEIEKGIWKTFSIEAFLFNNSLPNNQLSKSQPLIYPFHQIVAGTIWNNKTKSIELELYHPHFTEKTTLNNFIDLSQHYFESLNAKRIGVHLSGGLDSGLIIALLKKLNIPFVPIGLKSETFEFRTERKIQEILLGWGEDGLLIDIEDYPFYADLDKIPKHQIPDAYIKSVANSNALARAFKEKGCDVVLSGQGGDTLLVDGISNIKDVAYNIGNEFMLPPEQDRVYSPLGLRLESFFADSEIIDYLSSARLGQKEDPLKLWMRNWAKEILPRELSEFSYYADFFGLTMWGLHQARPVIKNLMEEAYDISKFPHFSPKNVKKFLNQDVFSFEHQDYIKYCGLISVSSWYHSLFNN